MVWIHIAGGLAALLAGFVALYTRKGGATHRTSGRVFAYAMFLMTLSGAAIAALLRPNPGNVLAASTTFYLVATGWLAVRASPEAAPARYQALCGLGFVTGAYGAGLAAHVLQLPGRSLDGIPGMAMGIFALIAIAAASADVRLICRGTLVGNARIMRHLWRMGLAMWIATASFFLGQADEFPRAVRATGLLSVPVLAVGLTLAYWIVRQRMVSRRAKRATLAPGALSPPAR